MQKSLDTDYDAVIVGGGMVGLTLACALGQQQFKVAVIESRQPEDLNPDDDYELRVSAISKSSQQVFQHINAWPGMLSRRASAYQHMHVWDSGGDGKIHFDAADLGVDALGHIIENRAIQFALYEQLTKLPCVDWICPHQVTEFTLCSAEINIVHELLLDSGQKLRTALLVGADGAQSNVRQAAGIELNTADYAQQGVVAVVNSARHHQDTAWQRFLPTGPLAFLPLSNGSCSIVWSLENEQADQVMSLTDEAFIAQLELAFDRQLGSIESLSQRAAFPLRRRHAMQYVKPGLALVGDAAHTIHPLAGQGVNLGILDAAALAQVIFESRAQGQPIGSLSRLRRYERWRRADNTLMMYSMSAFKNLFGSEQATPSLVRNLGLNLVDNLGGVKHKLMRHAMGLQGDLPDMAQPIGW